VGLGGEAGDLGFLFGFSTGKAFKTCKAFIGGQAKGKCRTEIKRKDGSFRAVPEGAFHSKGEISDRFP